MQINDLLSLFTLLLGNDIDNFIELVGICHDRFGFYFIHELVEVIHDLIFKLLKFFDLSIDLI